MIWIQAAAMNTWIWSAVFHARDTLITERLDYFCATLYVRQSYSYMWLAIPMT